ncbi:MAG: class II fumarate hydratase [Desulfatibacillaceae bacterium]
MEFREERDTMGPVRVPDTAYYGPQTQRARDNFSISGQGFPPAFISTLGMLKKHMARVNADLGLLPRDIAEAVARAAKEVQYGKLDDQFIVDLFQTGSGTSTHMNANEVIAGRANELLTGERGGKDPVHPNDHVNLGQSSNDVIPTALHMSASLRIERHLLPALRTLHTSLADKGEEVAHVLKVGRTHLNDAVPMRLGQEFSGWARQMELGIERIHDGCARLREVALGGTAIGTGLNAHPAAAKEVVSRISEETNVEFSVAKNRFEAQGCQDAAVEASGAIRTVAVSLGKIANDVRLLASGPRCGIGELVLPSLQPGSSFMPGKVNPVICEVAVQTMAQVMGNDAAIAVSGQGGYLQLLTMLPVITKNLLESVEILGSAALAMAEKCVDRLTADEKHCRALVEESLALVTFLAPKIGYDKAAAVAKEAQASGRTVHDLVMEKGLLTQNEWDALLQDI